jgi:hypothetical protein
MADELDSTTVPADFVKEGDDWLAIFNPHVPRQMDVQLAARYVHERCVCFEDLWFCLMRLFDGLASYVV